MKARALPLLVGLLGPLQLLPDWWLCILLLLLPEGTSGNATLKRDSCADTLRQALLTHVQPPQPLLPVPLPSPLTFSLGP